MRRTKIVATLGPASDSVQRINELVDAGVDVFRLNLSHGTHKEHQNRVELVRSIALKASRPVAILLDLQGPKIRTGSLKERRSVTLEYGQTFTITIDRVEGNEERVSTTYTALPDDVRVGDRILLSDGLIELRVLQTSETDVITTVIHGGELREHQGINLPGVNVSAPAVTEKDAADLAFGLGLDVDYVAISFVRQPHDVDLLRSRIAEAGKNTPIIAKIEKPEALDHLEAIIERVDGVMVARGDLGVEMKPEQVPLIQKRVIQAANAVAKPVITATQMLESMIHNPRPTRAEASDVANAILDGTDAVMLSGETAVGEFPVEAVRMMVRIAEESERALREVDLDEAAAIRITKSVTAEAIAQATVAITRAMDVKAIVAFTQSGNTARLVAHNRPRVPILALTPSEVVYRRLSLIWGVVPLLCPYVERLDDLGDRVRERLLANGLARSGERVVMTGGHPLPSRGETNLLKIMEV